MTEHQTPVLWYEQLMAAGGLQMLLTSNDWDVDAAVRHVLWSGVTCHPADAGDEQCMRRGCSSPSCTVVRCYLPPGRCCLRAISEVWMQQSVMYCGTVLPATRQMLLTSNDWDVDAAVRHVLWSGVTCHPADAGDEQCLRCGCSSPSCTVARCYLPPGRCWRQAMSKVWMQQSIMYCGALCCRHVD